MSLKPSSETAFGLVIGRALENVGDGSDDDALPDYIPARGTVTFSPLKTRTITSDPSAFLRRSAVVCQLSPETGEILSSGLSRKPEHDPEDDNTPDIGVWLAAGVWRCQFKTGTSDEIPSFDFEVTEANDIDNPLDLVTAAPFEPSTSTHPMFFLEVPQTGRDGDILAWSSGSKGPELILISGQSVIEAAESADQSVAAAQTYAENAYSSLTNIHQVESELRDILSLTQSSEHPTFDVDLGEYTTESLSRFINYYKNGKVYGVQIPKSNTSACVKIHANADIPAPIPGTIAVPGIDPYLNLGPFFYAKVNGYVDEDGFPHVTAIEGDSRFKVDGSNGDVWVMTPTLYYQFLEQSPTESILSISDSWKQGFVSQPKAYLPDGRRRPFMLFARYPLSIVDGVARSISGVIPQTRTVSHNTLISICSNSTSGYSGKSYADDWYLKVMFLLKYGTKNQSAILSGTNSYAVSARPIADELETDRIILSATDADKFVIGSTVIVGTGSADRAAETSYDVATAIITNIETNDDGTKSLRLNLDAPIDVSSSMYVTSYLWFCGATDMIVGDGSPINNVSNKEPAQIQGIEIFHGLYETLGDLYLFNEGFGWTTLRVLDSKYAHASNTTAYIKSDTIIESPEGVWKYTAYPTNDDGLFYGKQYTASSTTGLADGTYLSSDSTLGSRQYLSFGRLSVGANVGLWVVNGVNALGSAYWYIGSRLSAIGRAG